MKRFICIFWTFTILLAQADDSSFTPAAGYVKLNIQAKTDNWVGVPLLHNVVDYETIASVTSNSLTITNGQWNPSQYVYLAGQQPATYEVEFITGNLKGLSYKILSNTTDTLGLDTQGDDLTSHRLGNLTPGDLIAVRPYWTVADVFGNTDSSLALNPFTTPPSLDEIEGGDCVLLPDNITIGLEKPYALNLAYVQQIGWRAAGNALTDQSSTILPAASAFVVHRQSNVDLQAVVIGNVPINAILTPIKGGNGAMPNDYSISLTSADPIPLNTAGLTHSNLSQNVIQPSTSLLSRDDELLAFSGRMGFHRAPDITLYYANGAWQQLGSKSSTIGQDFALQPGIGYIIRKRANHGNQDWLQTPP